jgi:hypothetical protein
MKPQHCHGHDHEILPLCLFCMIDLTVFGFAGIGTYAKLLAALNLKTLTCEQAC